MAASMYSTYIVMLLCCHHTVVNRLLGGAAALSDEIFNEHHIGSTWSLDARSLELIFRLLHAVITSTRVLKSLLRGQIPHTQKCMAYFKVALMLQCCVYRRLSSVCTECIVAKRCVLEQRLLLTAYRKSYMRNRLVPK